MHGSDLTPSGRKGAEIPAEVPAGRPALELTDWSSGLSGWRCRGIVPSPVGLLEGQKTLFWT